MTLTGNTKALAATLSISAAGLLFIQQHEGTKTAAYQDTVKVWTICTGSTTKVRPGQIATLAECTARLQEDTTYAGKAIARCTTQPVTQGQYDALVSFTFNVGGGAYCRSTLVRKLNAGDCSGAANEFQRWNRAGGRVLPSLTKRRADEAALFRKDCPR